MSHSSRSMDLQLALERRTQVNEFQRRHRVALLTLVFTDIVGSTRLKQELGDRAAIRLIQQHHALVRELVGRFEEGQEISTAGDSFFLVFAKPSDAVAFALQLHARLRALSRETGTELLDRVGIHVGEVFVEQHEGSTKPKDLYGIQVDTCTRVMSLAGGGRTLMTRFAFENSRQALKGHTLEDVGPLTWLSHGYYQLKGVEEPLEICEVGEKSHGPLPRPEDSEKVRRVSTSQAPSREAAGQLQTDPWRGGSLPFANRVREQMRTEWRSILVGGAVTAVLGLIFLLLPLGRELTYLSYDLPFLFRGNLPQNEVVLVYMDDESQQKLKQPDMFRWDRRVQARLIERLTQAGAKAIVFDILFDEEASREEDDALTSAAQRHGNVIFAAKLIPFIVEGNDAGKRLRKPIEALEKIASWGLVVLAGEDKFIREHYRPAEDFKEPSLAWRVANATLAGGAPDANRPRWINYYGPPGFLPKQSFADVLEPGLIPSEVFSNKVIFVGAHFGVGFKGGSGTDDFRTPYTRWTQNRSPGVEINATTYLNLAHGDWLEEMSPWIELSLVLLAGGLLALGLAVVRPLPAVGIAALAALLVAVASIALVWTTRIWFPWLIVCVVQIPAALGWSILLHAQRNSRVHTTSVLPVPTPSEATQPSNLQTIRAVSANSIRELQIPDHTLVRTIGSGAYGDVWLARDVIGTFHAVKIIHRERFKTSDPFEREFRGIQKFTPISRQHPNWVHILHVGRNDQEGIFYYIMELGDDRVCGQRIDPQSYSPRTLAKDLERMRKLPVRDCLSIGIALASGLHFLHQHQLVHRDIKPSNVIFVNGVPKFADIGLVTTAATADSDRSYVGTEGFIAPEGPGTVVADVYSLGKLLYEASMGQDRKQFPAFPDSLAEREDRAALLELNKIILRACAAVPEQRCPTAEALMKDLQALQEKLFGGAALPREQSPRAPASPA